MRTTVFIILTIVLFSCDDKSDNVTDPDSESTVTDYSNSLNWMEYSLEPVESADVFYIHPTTYYDSSSDAPPNWEIDRNSEVAFYAYGAFISQASLFDGVANIYAPLYRQVRVRDLEDFPEQNSDELAVAYADVKAAFEYFFDNNDGRPFFIMGHSQGANLGLTLAEDLFSDSKYLNKLIAAYIIGWPVTQDDLNNYPHLKVLSQPDETGGVIAWDVVSEDVSMVLPTYAPNSIMVNPLTWTLTNEPVPAENNIGAVFYGEVGLDYLPIGIAPEFTGGQIKEMPAIPGYIETSYTAFVTQNLNEKLAEAGADVGKYAVRGCYHVEAVNLFYMNIAENATVRKAAFFSK